jgi:hypothetical protein
MRSRYVLPPVWHSFPVKLTLSHLITSEGERRPRGRRSPVTGALFEGGTAMPMPSTPHLSIYAKDTTTQANSPLNTNLLPQ